MIRIPRNFASISRKRRAIIFSCAHAVSLNSADFADFALYRENPGSSIYPHGIAIGSALTIHGSIFPIGAESAKSAECKKHSRQAGYARTRSFRTILTEFREIPRQDQGERSRLSDQPNYEEAIA
jgi:hypothetical protein